MALVVAVVPAVAAAQADAPRRLDRGRFTIVFYPVDELLASSLLTAASGQDSFPWIPRPAQQVLIAIAPDASHFRQWAGPSAPEWGAALAFPESRRIIMQGRHAASSAGNPLEVLRHELAHLALHEFVGREVPRWLDEGYASLSAREWTREDVLSANVALAFRGPPGLDALEREFQGGSVAAQSAYALSYQAVRELSRLDPERGLALFLGYLREGRSLDGAVRQAFGITLAGFEVRFQQQTRRRYGGLALVTDISLASVVLLLLMAPFYLARRRRDRGRLARMRESEAAFERAERERVIAWLLSLEEPSV